MFINSDIPIRIPINYRDGSPYHIHCHVVGLLARMHSCRWFTFAKLPCPTFDSRRELTQTDKPFLWSLPNLPSSSTMYCISHDIFKTTPTSGLKSSTIMMFSIWVCSEIGFLETNRVDHHSRLICEPRLLAVLGVCQWIVTTVLKLSHCSRNLGEVWVRAELLWGNVLPSQKSSPFFCMSVPASKTLRACRMNFRFYMWTTSHALQTRPIPWIAPACFFFFSGGTEVLSEHLKKAITVAIGVFQACWSWADCSPLHLLSPFSGGQQDVSNWSLLSVSKRQL